MASSASRVTKLLVVVIAVMLPGLAASILGFGQLSVGLAYGAMMGLSAGLMVGPLLLLRLAVPAGVAAFATMLASDRPWLALLVMGVVAGAVGYSSRWGYSQSLTLVPISLGFILTMPPTITGGRVADAAIIGGLVVLGLLWTALLTWSIESRITRPPLQPLVKQRALLYALNYGVVVGIAAWFAIRLDLQHGGAWMLLTLCLVIQPYLQDAWSRTIQRLGGTLIGFVIAYLLGLVVPFQTAGYIVGIAFLIVALAILTTPTRPYWQFVLFLTPAVILLGGSSGSVTQTAIERVVFTIIGVVVSLVVVAMEYPFAKRTAARDHLAKF